MGGMGREVTNPLGELVSTLALLSPLNTLTWKLWSSSASTSLHSRQGNRESWQDGAGGVGLSGEQGGCQVHD